LLRAIRPVQAIVGAAGMGMMAITVALMVGMRHMLRLTCLADYADLGALKIQPQSGVIALFLALFILGLATVGYMLGLLFRAGRAPSGSAPGPS